MYSNFNKDILFTLLIIIAITFYVFTYMLLRSDAIIYSLVMYGISVVSTIDAIFIWNGMRE